MHRLKILGLKVHVPPCHLQSGMSQNSLEPEHVPSIAQIVDRERMTDGVDLAPNALNAEPMAKVREVPLSVALAQSRSGSGSKHSVVLVLLEPAEENLTEFGRHRYKALLLTLSVNTDQHVFEIEVATL